jgi:hypothetical protein
MNTRWAENKAQRGGTQEHKLHNSRWETRERNPFIHAGTNVRMTLQPA